MSEPQDEGIDILRFFLGVMSLLTVFVAGFALYNWSKASSLEADVKRDLVELVQIQSKAKNPEFLNMVAQDAQYNSYAEVKTKDFARFLNDAARQLNLELQSFTSAGGPSSARRTFDEQGYKFTIDKQPLDVIVAYLWYIQGSWPGLKIKDLSISEVKGRRGEPSPGWRATATASIFRPREGGS